MDNTIKGNIWKIHLHKILRGVFFAVPIMVLFWQDNGLSLTQIMFLQSIFAISVVILEIPTGYFSDRYGRKKTLIIAGIMSLLGIISYSFSYNFYHFLIAELFFAFSISFESGTISAFVYDTLLELKQEKKYKIVWGNILFTGMLSLAISGIIGSFIAKVDLRYPLYASIPFFVLLIPITFSLKEPNIHKGIVEKGYTKKIFHSIKTSLLENKKLRWLIIYSGVIYGFNQSALWLYQPYFKIIGLDIIYFGFVFASFQIVAAFSSKYSHKIEKKLGEKYSLSILIILVSISYFLMSNFIYLFSFSFCFIQQFIRGFKNTIITDYINQLTKSNMRATILSLESFVSRLFYALIIPFIGYIADIYTLVQALSVLGITTLLSGIIILFFLKKDKVI